MFRMNGFMTAAILAAAAGCGDAATTDCRAEHGYADVTEVDPRTQQTPAQIGAVCTQAGATDCDAAKFISRAAAECIARAEDLPPGISPWHTSVVYNGGHKTAIWSVQSTTSSMPGRKDGQVFLIHATTGKVLERNDWAVVN